MSTLQLLISGDYWHADFRDQFSSLGLPTTMVPLDRIESAPDHSYDLIILAQSRRDQISQASVDALRESMPEVPIVVLLGTWCEGENRSGKPLIGVNQVFWHQWQSRFEKFCIQMNDGVKSDWHLPLTASVSDRVRDFAPASQHSQVLSGSRILISSEDRTSFESISDLLKVYQCETFWRESQTQDVFASDFGAICIDGNTASSNLLDRVRDLQAEHQEVPVIALLNFPRKQDLVALAGLGIQEVVSKPFTADEFVIPLLRAVGDDPNSNSRFASRPASLLSKTLQ